MEDDDPRADAPLCPTCKNPMELGRVKVEGYPCVPSFEAGHACRSSPKRLSGIERSVACASVPGALCPSAPSRRRKKIRDESDREPTVFEFCAKLDSSQTPTLSPDAAHTPGGTFFFAVRLARDASRRAPAGPNDL
jgi:hypothetical protein